MHTKDAIKFALAVSNGAVLSVIDEMSGAATTFPTPNGGCHPLWVLGHLTLVEASEQFKRFKRSIVASARHRDLERHLLQPDDTAGASRKTDGGLDLMLVHQLVPAGDLLARGELAPDSF